MDTKEAKIILENNPTWDKFIRKYWLDFEEYAKVQDYNPDVIVLNHKSVRRIAYIVLAGELEAYTVTKQDAKLLPVYNFQQGMTIGDVIAIFNSPWTFGLRTLTSTHLLAIDLEQIEHTTKNTGMYEELFEILHSELGVLTAEINCNRVDNKINVKEILPEYLFKNILDDISDSDYEILRANLKFIFYNSNESILSFDSKIADIYFIQTGKLIKINSVNNKEIECEDSFGEQEFFEGKKSQYELFSATKSLIIKFGIENFLTNCSENLKNSIYKILMKQTNQELEDTKRNLSLIERELDAQKIRDKRISTLSIKMLIFLSLVQLFFSAEHVLQTFHAYRPFFHSIMIFWSILTTSFILKESHVNIASLGFTSHNKKAYIELGIVVIILLFVSIVFNELLIAYAKDSVIKIFLYAAYLAKEKLYTSIYWYYILLSFVYIVLYEIILRGIWQTWFESLFKGTYWVRAWKSIFAVNIISSMFYHSLFYEFYIVMFFASLCFGYIYAKYRNLYAVILGHIIYELIVITEVGLVVF